MWAACPPLVLQDILGGKASPYHQHVIVLGVLQAVLDFIERERTPEVVKMHVVEIFNLTSEQVQRTFTT